MKSHVTVVLLRRENRMLLKHYFSVLSGNPCQASPVWRELCFWGEKRRAWSQPVLQSGFFNSQTCLNPKHSLPNEITEGVRTGSWVGELSEKAELENNGPTTRSSCWNSEPLNQVLLPREGHSLFVCFKPRANGATWDSFSGIHHLSNCPWHFTHLLFAHQQLFLSTVFQHAEQKQTQSTPTELTTYPDLHCVQPIDSHQPITRKHTISSCMGHKCGDVNQSKVSEKMALKKW